MRVGNRKWPFVCPHCKVECEFELVDACYMKELSLKSYKCLTCGTVAVLRTSFTEKKKEDADELC